MAKTHKCISRKHKACGRNGKRMFSANGAEWHAANNGGRFKTKADEAKEAKALAGMAKAASVASTVLAGEDLPLAQVHLVKGNPIPPEGLPYGTLHDRDCPPCVTSGASFQATPRSEAYWAS